MAPIGCPLWPDAIGLIELIEVAIAGKLLFMLLVAKLLVAVLDGDRSAGCCCAKAFIEELGVPADWMAFVDCTGNPFAPYALISWVAFSVRKLGFAYSDWSSTNSRFMFSLDFQNFLQQTKAIIVSITEKMNVDRTTVNSVPYLLRERRVRLISLIVTF